jgi:hypothetical protein
MNWTPHLDGTLRRLIDQGMTYEEAAQAMNQDFGLALSKGAVIGRGRRIGIPPRKEPAPPPVWYVRRVLTNRPPARPGELRIEELTYTTCRWPNGEGPPYSYCGARSRQGEPYCQTHAEKSNPALKAQRRG